MSETITKEMVEERLQLYQKELQQLFGVQKIYEGAIQDCQHWLTTMDTNKEEKETDVG